MRVVGLGSLASMKKKGSGAANVSILSTEEEDSPFIDSRMRQQHSVNYTQLRAPDAMFPVCLVVDFICAV